MLGTYILQENITNIQLHKTKGTLLPKKEGGKVEGPIMGNEIMLSSSVNIIIIITI